MREILFRGQVRKRGQKVNMNGEKLPGVWVYGGIFPGTGDYSIIYGGATEKLTGLDLEKYVVWSDTVGQFTGLTDKNGKKIFEGDIVTISGSKMMGFPAPVAYFPQGAVFQIRRNGYNAITLWDANVTAEVIGNIHDNPELLEVNHV